MAHMTNDVQRRLTELFGQQVISMNHDIERPARAV